MRVIHEKGLPETAGLFTDGAPWRSDDALEQEVSLDPVDPGQQLAYLIRVVLDLLDLIEVADALGVGQDVLALGVELGSQQVAAIVDQQAVLRSSAQARGLRLLPVSRAHSSSTKIPLR